MDLVKQIMNEFSGDAFDRLGSQLGISSSATRKATEAAVPTILSSLAGLAASDDGAKKLSSTLGGLDLGKISSLANMFGDVSGGAQKGGGLLSSLFGDNLISTISSAIASFSGINGATIKKLLSFVLPFILGKVAGSWQAKGGTPSALQRLFVDQQDKINDAMPAGFSLPSLPGLPSAEGMVRSVGRTANTAGAAVRDTTRHVAATAKDTSWSFLSWLLPLAALLLAALGLWYFFGPGRAGRNVANNAADATANAAKEAADAAKTGADRITALKPTLPDVPDLNLVTKDLTGTFASAKQVFSGIRDAASAEAALPQLTAMSTKIDGFRSRLDKLPATGQAALGTLIGDQMGPFREQVARILALPNISAKVRSTLQGITGKLAGMNLAKVSQDATNIFKTLTTTLTGMNDVAAAEAAVPKLRDVSSQLDELKQVQSQMSPGGQSMLAKIIAAARGPLDKLISRVVTTLGADAAIVKPVLDEIVNKLTGLAPPPA